MRAFLLAMLLAACAPSTPYVWTRPVEPWRIQIDRDNPNDVAWFDDGPVMRVTAVNPLPVPVYMLVQCTGERPELGQHQEWWVTVPARTEVRALTQVMNKDVMAEPCWVKEFWRKAP